MPSDAYALYSAIRKRIAIVEARATESRDRCRPQSPDWWMWTGHLGALNALGKIIDLEHNQLGEHAAEVAP